MKKIILITKTALEKIPPVISDLYILLDLGYRPSIIVTGISDGLKRFGRKGSNRTPDTGQTQVSNHW